MGEKCPQQAACEICSPAMHALLPGPVGKPALQRGGSRQSVGARRYRSATASRALALLTLAASLGPSSAVTCSGSQPRSPVDILATVLACKAVHATAQQCQSQGHAQRACQRRWAGMRATRLICTAFCVLSDFHSILPESRMQGVPERLARHLTLRSHPLSEVHAPGGAFASAGSAFPISQSAQEQERWTTSGATLAPRVAARADDETWRLLCSLPQELQHAILCMAVSGGVKLVCWRKLSHACEDGCSPSRTTCLEHAHTAWAHATPRAVEPTRGPKSGVCTSPHDDLILQHPTPLQDALERLEPVTEMPAPLSEAAKAVQEVSLLSSWHRLAARSAPVCLRLRWWQEWSQASFGAACGAARRGEQAASTPFGLCNGWPSDPGWSCMLSLLGNVAPQPLPFGPY